MKKRIAATRLIYYTMFHLLDDNDPFWEQVPADGYTRQVAFRENCTIKCPTDEYLHKWRISQTPYWGNFNTVLDYCIAKILKRKLRVIR